jgi:hypothetical protein
MVLPGAAICVRGANEVGHRAADPTPQSFMKGAASSKPRDSGAVSAFAPISRSRRVSSLLLGGERREGLVIGTDGHSDGG